MAVTKYRIYALIDTALEFVGTAEASSAEGAVRAYYSTNDAEMPSQLAVIPERSLHSMRARVETQMRLRIE